MIGRFRQLRAKGVLGINRRNSHYTLRCNSRKLYPLVDDKLATKRICEEAGIPTPKLLAVARHHVELRTLAEQLEGHSSFVLKPARGSMGNGVLVIVDRDGDRFQRARGTWVGMKDLLYHAASTISGLYALAGHSDVAFVEERLEVDPRISDMTFQGVPDIRVIVLKGVPVMAMTRLPTRAAGGRANLHQGAVGVGIHLATGVTNHAQVRNEPILNHPDTGALLVGRTVPDFRRVLEIAVQVTDPIGLGYVGADIVLDAHRGPVVLELNARPGLAIQISNAAGLIPRLERIERAVEPGMTVEERIALGLDVERITRELHG